MKILIFGAFGMLGHKIFNELSLEHDVYATSRGRALSSIPECDVSRIISEIDANDLEAINKLVERQNPDIIINCVGIIKQLSDSHDTISMMYLNSVFPHRLACVAHDNGSRLIHFSTDCIFSGRKGMYKTSDVADAEDVYGKTKYLGELSYKNCLTIRSSIIGPEINTKNGLLEWFLSQRGKTINGYKNSIFSGFTTLEMSKIVSLILNRRPHLSGVWQVASSPISKFDLLTLINEKMDLKITINPDYSFVCDRSLDGSDFSKATGYIPPSWNKMIDELVLDMNKNIKMVE